jgi:hypothetical protein
LAPIAKTILEIWINSCPLGAVSLVRMKTQSIMITLTIKFAINDFEMEFSCVDFKAKNSKSILIDYGVEFLIGYFISMEC